MTKDECIAALQRALSEPNLGSLQGQLRRITIPPDAVHDDRLQQLLKAVLHRARREGLLDRTPPPPACECGHERERHEAGLVCQKCADCAVFRPTADRLPDKEAARDDRKLTRSWWEAGWDLTPETRHALMVAEHEQEQRGRNHELAAPNPWAHRIQERQRAEDVIAAATTMKNVAVQRLPPGASAHMVSAERTRARREAREAKEAALKKGMREILDQGHE
jgi:hypothetical protein